MRQNLARRLIPSSGQVLILALSVGILSFGYLFDIDNKANVREREQIINLLVSTAPKLIRDGEFIKLHALVNTRTDIGICITDTLNRFLVSNSSANCKLTSAEARELFYESKAYGNLIVSNHFDFQAHLPFYLVFLLSWGAVLSTLLYLKNRHQSNLSLDYLNHLLDSDSPDQTEPPSWLSKKFQPLHSAVTSFKETAIKINEFEIDKAKNEAIVEVASQVSHDIRSPLMALEMMSSKLDSVPDADRVIIRNSINRIKSIANTLLANSRTQKEEKGRHADEATKSSLLSDEIEQILSESRILGSVNPSTQIEFHQSTESIDAFTNIDSTALKRVISNIVNNALESLQGKSGKISLEVSKSEDGNIALQIKDTGIGISEDHLKLIGTNGFTSGKHEGNGLGLYSAITILNQWGGKLTLQSKAGVGTEVKITLPSADPPIWFTKTIALPKEGCVVVVDDDFHIHNLWKKRFEELEGRSFPLSFKYYSSPSELRSFMKEDYLNSHSTLFLVDHDFLLRNESGLNLIEQLGIASEAILVTNRYSDEAIQKACIKLNIKILPKPLIPKVSFI